MAGYEKLRFSKVRCDPQGLDFEGDDGLYKLDVHKDCTFTVMGPDGEFEGKAYMEKGELEFEGLKYQDESVREWIQDTLKEALFKKIGYLHVGANWIPAFKKHSSGQVFLEVRTGVKPGDIEFVPFGGAYR